MNLNKKIEKLRGRVFKLHTELIFLKRKCKRILATKEALQSRVNYLSKVEEESRELRAFQRDLFRWMRGVSFGQFPFNIMKEHLKTKINRGNLLKLYNAAVNERIHLRKRALIAIYHLYGVTDHLMMEFLGISRNTVKRNKRKFELSGVDTLLDCKHKRRGADESVLKEMLFTIIHSPPSEYGYNRTRWTLKLIKQALDEKGIIASKNRIPQTLREANYRFCKAKMVLTSNDPEYSEKVRIITNILSKLRRGQGFYSIDEFGPFLVKKKIGWILTQAGNQPTVPHWQPSKGKLILIGALELSTNQVTHFYSESKTSDQMKKLLRILLRKNKGQKKIYLSWDSASWHSSSSLLKEVSRINRLEYRNKYNTPIVKLAPLPSRAQFLNVIESVFSGMASAIIQNSDYQSVKEAKSAISRYFRERNAHFRKYPMKAGGKIWKRELVPPAFKEGQNCKNPKWR